MLFHNMPWWLVCQWPLSADSQSLGSCWKSWRLGVAQTERCKVLVGIVWLLFLWAAASAASKNPTCSKKRNQMPWCVLSSLKLLFEPPLNNKWASHQVRSQESGRDAPNSSRSKSGLPPAMGWPDSGNKSEAGWIMDEYGNMPCQVWYYSHGITMIIWEYGWEHHLLSTMIWYLW